jgi:Lipocalin-like domain
MKRDRSGGVGHAMSPAGQNNTSAVDGYDAYFGTYEVDEQTGKVKHTLVGSITPTNIGMTVMRDLRVDGDTLMIQLDTTTPGGEPITRTLTWKRIT